MIDKVQTEDPVEEREALTGAVESPADEAPKDLRSQLREAIREHSEPEGDNTSETSGTKPAAKTDDDVSARMAKAREAKAAQAAARRATQTSAQSQTNVQGATQSSATSVKQPDPSRPDAQAGPKPDAPPFWKSKGREVWDSLTPAAQQAIINREQEVSNGFAQYAPKARAFDDLAKVIEPHLPAIQRFGVTVPQTIDRLFGWMNALSHPNDSQRMEAFKALAQSFRVNLAQLSPGQVQQGQEQTQNQDAPPNWFSEYHGYMQNRLAGLEAAARNAEQAQQAQTVNAASTYLGTWAKDKPYYEQVRHDMKYFIETGRVPNLPNGALDLDTAYKYAVQYNPDVQNQIKADEAAKAKADADVAAKAKAKEAADRLARARRAGSSIRPAQAMVMTAPPSQANGARPPGNRNTPVGQSLREAIRELNDQ